MKTMHSMLLVGPYDWEADVMPRQEFTERIDAFWKAVADPACRGAVIYGDSRHHSELVYLTGFTPRVRNAMALIPRQGAPTVLVSGSKAGLSSAKRMTWVENVDLLSDPGKAVVSWAKALGGGTAPARVALIGSETMRAPMYQGIVESLGPNNPPLEATAGLRAQMQRKRPKEFEVLRRACELLKAATHALGEAQNSGASVTAAALHAERAASQLGAQDVQVLFSLDRGRTLRPFTIPVDKRVDPLQAYIAVRFAGYWADGMVSVASSPHPALAKAGEALKAMLPMAKAGATGRDLARKPREALRPFSEHPMTARSIGNSIGVSLDEEPRLLSDSDVALQAGGAYTLRVGATDGAGCHAIVSAMVAVSEAGNEVLWSSV